MNTYEISFLVSMIEKPFDYDLDKKEARPKLVKIQVQGLSEQEAFERFVQKIQSIMD